MGPGRYSHQVTKQRNSGVEQHHNYHKNNRTKQSVSQAPHINRSHVDPEIAGIGDNSNNGAKSNRKDLFKMNGIVPP